MIQAIAQRWIFSDPIASDRRALVNEIAVTVGLSLVLLAALNAVDLLHRRAPMLWMATACIVALAMIRVRYRRRERPALRLWQGVGIMSALYALFHYPLMPVLPGDMLASLLYGGVVAMWLIALVCGVACLRVPSLALIPPVYIAWSIAVAPWITGLRRGHTLDIAPLPEVAFCIALGLLILHLHRWLSQRFARLFPVNSGDEFGRIVLYFAIGIHLANYFWSGIAKLALDGPPFAWVRFNNPLYLYLAALDNGYIPFAAYGELVGTIAQWIDRTYLLSNVLVLSFQLIAIAGFLLPKRWLIALLFAFDAMHVSIWVISGANFWLWVLLNIAVVYAVAMKETRQPKLLVGLTVAAFVVISPKVANVAWLGWYDSAANNKTYFEAEDAAGQRYYVPPTFFAFYSYPMAHMSYGMPEPESAFATYHPNGGAYDYAVARAGVRCDTDSLHREGAQRAPSPAFSRFVVNYHALATLITEKTGRFPLHAYAHHFYVPPSRTATFESLPLDNVVAYIYRRESVCLSMEDGLPQRKLVSSAELRIDLPQ